MAIERQVWRAVARSRDRPVGFEWAEPEAEAEAAWQRAMAQAALPDALRHLPERLRHIVLAAYGLQGESPRSLAAIGRGRGEG